METVYLALAVSHPKMAQLDTASDLALCHSERETAGPLHAPRSLKTLTGTTLAISRSIAACR